MSVYKSGNSMVPDTEKDKEAKCIHCGSHHIETTRECCDYICDDRKCPQCSSTTKLVLLCSECGGTEII